MPSAEPSSAPRRGRPPRLDRDQLLTAALAIVDRDGAADFTMRALAKELDVGVMTLYGYVSSRDELVEEVALKAVADLLTGLPAGAEAGVGWEAHLRAVTYALHEVSERHAELVAIVLRHRAQPGSAPRVRDLIIGVLVEAGFSGRQATLAFGALTSYVLGFSVVHASVRFGDDAEPVSQDGFDFGLDLLLDGLRRELER